MIYPACQNLNSVRGIITPNQEDKVRLLAPVGLTRRADVVGRRWSDALGAYGRVRDGGTCTVLLSSYNYKLAGVINSVFLIVSHYLRPLSAD